MPAAARILWILLGTAVAWAAEADPLVSLQSLDQYLVDHQVTSVESFLSRPEVVDGYFQLAQSYYGGDKEFSRASYDAVLKQLKEISPRLPGLSERLFKPLASRKTLHVETELKSSGLTLKSDEWVKYSQSLLEEMRKLSQEFRWGGADPAVSPPLQHSEFLALARDFAKEWQERLAEIERLPKSAQGKVRGEWVKSLRDRKELKALAAWAFERKWLDPEFKDVLPLSQLENLQADVVIENWKKLTQAGGLNCSHLPAEAQIPAEIQPFLASMVVPPLELPDLKVNAQGQPNENAFFTTTWIEVGHAGARKKVPVGRAPRLVVESKPLPRAFHGIFKGVSVGECVGGACENLDQLTPERWLTAAVSDVRVDYVEVGGRFNGFVQEVPGRIFRGENSELYYSIEWMAPVLTQELPLKRGREGKVASVSLMEAWMQQARDRLPTEAKGWVMGSTDAFDNARGVIAARRQPIYAAAPTVAQGQDKFLLLDPWIRDLVEASRPYAVEKNSRYSGVLVVEGSYRGNTSLRRLRAWGLPSDSQWKAMVVNFERLTDESKNYVLSRLTTAEMTPAMKAYALRAVRLQTRSKPYSRFHEVYQNEPLLRLLARDLNQEGSPFQMTPEMWAEAVEWLRDPRDFSAEVAFELIRSQKRVAPEYWRELERALLVRPSGGPHDAHRFNQRWVMQIPTHDPYIDEFMNRVGPVLLQWNDPIVARGVALKVGAMRQVEAPLWQELLRATDHPQNKASRMIEGYLAVRSDLPDAHWERVLAAAVDDANGRLSWVTPWGAKPLQRWEHLQKDPRFHSSKWSESTWKVISSREAALYSEHPLGPIMSSQQEHLRKFYEVEKARRLNNGGGVSSSGCLTPALKAL